MHIAALTEVAADTVVGVTRCEHIWPLWRFLKFERSSKLRFSLIRVVFWRKFFFQVSKTLTLQKSLFQAEHALYTHGLDENRGSSDFVNNIWICYRLQCALLFRCLLQGTKNLYTALPAFTAWYKILYTAVAAKSKFCILHCIIPMTYPDGLYKVATAAILIQTSGVQSMFILEIDFVI